MGGGGGQAATTQCFDCRKVSGLNGETLALPWCRQTQLSPAEGASSQPRKRASWEEIDSVSGYSLEISPGLHGWPITFAGGEEDCCRPTCSTNVPSLART